MIQIRLQKLTIIIPCRIDTIQRQENLLVNIRYLRNFETDISIIEADSYDNQLLKTLVNQRIDFHFIYDYDPIFYRTHYINKIVKEIQTPYVGVWDTDVICPIDQLNKAIEVLQNNEADFVYPYDKFFLDTSPILRKLYIRTGDINFLLKNMKKMKEMYPPNPLGGAFLANMKAYRDSGFENENFYGWGLEDGERYHRWEKLGYRIKRIPGPLFHLSHGRGLNSTFHDADQNITKRRELMNMIRARVPENKDIILT